MLMKNLLASIENLFNGVTSLKYIDLSGFGSSLLTNLESLFEDLNKLESVKYSNIKTSKVTSIKSMFENCAALTLIDLPVLDTNSLINMEKLCLLDYQILNFLMNYFRKLTLN